jgi:large subunit ribosomal protein L33
MAKKTNRVLIGLVCKKCKHQNYVSEKNKVNTTDKVLFSKFCKVCREITEHKEKPKLK